MPPSPPGDRGKSPRDPTGAPPGHRQPPKWLPPCGGGSLFWGLYNKDPAILGTILGSPILGNSHVLAASDNMLPPMSMYQLDSGMMSRWVLLKPRTNVQPETCTQIFICMSILHACREACIRIYIYIHRKCYICI